MRNNLIRDMQYFFHLYGLPRNCRYDAIIRNSCGRQLSLGIVMTNVMFLLILEFASISHLPDSSFVFYFFFTYIKCYVANTSLLIRRHITL